MTQTKKQLIRNKFLNELKSLKMKYAKSIIALFITTLAILNVNAQDGEGLFKAKCNTCHMLGKNSTGPNLKGVKQKWTDAGEGEMIYEWVMNPQALIASGKSTSATAAKEFSPTDMTPQAVSKEEIDAILSFVDTYEPPIETTSATGDPVVPVIEVPDYESNLTMFYFLIALLIVQLIGIIVLGSSMKYVVKIEFEKFKSKNNDVVKTLFVLIGIFGLMANGNMANAITYVGPGIATEPSPWLLIENSDLYFMLYLNLLALAGLLYMRKSFMDMIKTVRPESIVKRKRKSSTSNLNKVLTDIVPIEEEHTILMHHEYDGIKELDNNLPPWWVWGFYATIVFAVVYMFNYHIFHASDLQIAEYNNEMKRAEKEVSAYLDKMAMNVDENSVTLMVESSDLTVGRTLYEVNCVSCHNPAGEGNIGPNLTDKNWIYGFDIKTVFTTIKNGTPKGMPEHNSKLNPVQLQQVSSYVLSLKEAKGKEPQGEFIEK